MSEYKAWQAMAPASEDIQRWATEVAEHTGIPVQVTGEQTITAIATRDQMEYLLDKANLFSGEVVTAHVISHEVIVMGLR